MKLKLVVSTPKGCYDKLEIEGRNLKALLDKVLSALDDMPDELDGCRPIDWTYINLYVTR